MEARADGWLAEVIGVPTFRVDGDGSTEPVERHAGGQARAFYYAKVDTARTDRVAALSRIGFSVVDTAVTFERARDVAARPGQVSVGELGDAETDAVLDIAGTAFRYSRFHLDPQFPDEIANKIKREWVRNYARRARGDKLLVARLGGRPIGFLAALIAGDAAVIDLIATATDAQGNGAGSALCAAFAEAYRGRKMLVGTQVANVPSVRLYTRCGYELAHSQYVLHRHVGG